MRIPPKAFKGHYDRRSGKFLYYATEYDYYEGKYRLVNLPKWFLKAFREAMKDSHEAGIIEIKRAINDILK